MFNDPEWYSFLSNQKNGEEMLVKYHPEAKTSGGSSHDLEEMFA